MHIVLKAGKPQSTNSSSPILFKHFSIQQPIKACNPTSPAGSWHYPLQLYTTLRVVGTFNMPLKLMFYQNTHIVAICMLHGLSLGFPSSDVTTSFPLWYWELHNQPCTILCQITITKLTCKDAQLLFRHHSTSRPTFNFCCIDSAVQRKVKIKPSLTV